MRTKESIGATCPECRGPLTVFRTESLAEIRCLVGHAYTVAGLLRAHSDTQEKALWSAVVSLRETEAMLDALRDHFPDEVLKRLEAQVAKKKLQAAVIEKVLQELEPFEPDAPGTMAP